MIRNSILLTIMGNKINIFIIEAVDYSKIILEIYE